MDSSDLNKEPSIIVGGLVLGGVMIGAGMFSLPTIMAGAWFLNSSVILFSVCFFMFLSGTYILECISRYGEGANYSHISKKLLPAWLFYSSNASLIFVLYILIYAYISAAGSVIHEAAAIYGLKSNINYVFILFTLILGSIVWYGGNLSSRVTSLFLLFKIILFTLAFSGLFLKADIRLLLNPGKGNEQVSLLPYTFIIIPYAITSFGFHGNVCSLYKLYNQNPKKVIRSCVLGCVLALCLYLLWMIGTMGNLPRQEFLPIIAAGGNLNSFIDALYSVLSSPYIQSFLLWFSISAVFCSFLGVSIGLFDYILAALKLPENKKGKTKSALLCFLPPLLLCLLFPNGFLIAISYAGTAACIWAVISPAVMVLNSRRLPEKTKFTAFGGNFFVFLVIAFGITGIVCQTLAQLGLLPVYR